MTEISAVKKDEPQKPAEKESSRSASGQESQKDAPDLIDEDEIIEAISTVYDPEIPVNVYELGLIYAIDLHDDGEVVVEMSLTAPNCPMAQELPEMVRDAVLKVRRVKDAKVNVVWDPPWDISRMSDAARLSLNMY